MHLEARIAFLLRARTKPVDADEMAAEEIRRAIDARLVRNPVRIPERVVLLLVALEQDLSHRAAFGHDRQLDPVVCKKNGGQLFPDELVLRCQRRGKDESERGGAARHAIHESPSLMVVLGLKCRPAAVAPQEKDPGSVFATGWLAETAAACGRSSLARSRTRTQSDRARCRPVP